MTFYITIVVIITCLFSILFAGFADNFNILTHGKEILDDSDLSNVLYFISGMAAVALAIIAYSNLSSLNLINKNKHLIQIDQRWGDEQIIKARQIIHIIYREVCDENEKKKKPEKLENYTLIIMSLYIKKMSVDKQSEIRKLFTLILNYIDFMESISHIYKERDDEELKALIGNTLLFNYCIFYKYIKDKNKRHNKSQLYKGRPNDFYEKFTKFVEKTYNKETKNFTKKFNKNRQKIPPKKIKEMEEKINKALTGAF